MPTNYFEPRTEKVENEIHLRSNTDKSTVQQDIDTVRLWLSSQSHLPNTLTDHQIICFILLCKGSIEKIKSKIDMYYTMRSLFPDIFENSHPHCQRIKNARKYIYVIPLPKLCADYSRLLIFKLKDVDDPSNMCPLAVAAHLINIVEMRLQEDLCANHSILFDLQHCHLSHISKITPSFIRNIHTIAEKALTTKAQGIHLINAPKFFDQVVFLVKSIVKPKVASRIFLHKNMNSVLDSIDKNILPKDYGGNDLSLDEMEEKLWEKLEEYTEFFDKKQHEKVNEELRPKKSVNDEMLGYHGNFKKLVVD